MWAHWDDRENTDVLSKSGRFKILELRFCSIISLKIPITLCMGFLSLFLLAVLWLELQNTVFHKPEVKNTGDNTCTYTYTCTHRWSELSANNSGRVLEAGSCLWSIYSHRWESTSCFTDTKYFDIIEISI